MGFRPGLLGLGNWCSLPWLYLLQDGNPQRRKGPKILLHFGRVPSRIVWYPRTVSHHHSLTSDTALILSRVKLWAGSYDMPIYQHYIAHGIIDVLRNSGLSLWLLHTNIPDMGLAEDQAVGHPGPNIGLSETILIVRMAQIMYWYHTQTNA